MAGEPKAEGERVSAELLDQPLLESGRKREKKITHYFAGKAKLENVFFLMGYFISHLVTVGLCWGGG